MAKRIYILSLLVALFSQSVLAQFVQDNELSKAEFYLQKGEMDSAQKYLDEAVTTNKFNTEAKLWFYRAYVYKEQYKLKEKQTLHSELRNESASSILKLYETEGKETYAQQTEPLIKYVSSTYYNDAARAINNNDFDLAATNFNQYKKLQKLINTDEKTLIDQEIQFKFAIATAISKSSEEKIDSTKREQLINLFKDILAVDANNASANYNLSLLYYNQGVDIVNNMDYDMDFDKLLATQDKITALFNEALPYMLKAYEQDYRKEDTLEGLKNIYHGLNDLEKSNYYKQQLEEIQK